MLRRRLAPLVQRRLQRRIEPQLIVVVQVLVALAQTEHPLPQQLRGRMHNQIRIARIRQHLRRRFQQTELAFDLAQQQQACIRTDLATVETHLDAASSQCSKQVAFLGTIWHRRNPLREWTLSTRLTRDNMVAPTSFLHFPGEIFGLPGSERSLAVLFLWRARTPEPVDALILDLLEWIGPGARPYPEVIDTWRTSCPRLPVWEEANARG